MIRLANPVKTFKSPKLFQPTTHTGSSFTTHVVNHNLGVKPDHVALHWDDGRMIPDFAVIGANNHYYFVHEVTDTSVTIYIYRYATGDFYVTVAVLGDGVYDFS